MVQLSFSEHMSSQSKNHFAQVKASIQAECDEVGQHYDHMEEEYHAECLARDLDYISDCW